MTQINGVKPKSIYFNIQTNSLIGKDIGPFLKVFYVLAQIQALVKYFRQGGLVLTQIIFVFRSFHLVMMIF